MMRKHSAQTIFRVYELYKQGKTYDQVANETGVRNPPTLMLGLKKYLDGTGKGKTPAYLEAAEMIKRNYQEPKLMGAMGSNSKEDTPQTDRYGLLQYEYDNFQKELERFILYQVDEGIKQYKSEMEALRKENKELKQLKEELKNSNWINNLKKSFNGRSL